jgi:hypothetical protein
MTGGAGLHEGRRYKNIFGILNEGREKPYNRICLHSYRQRGMQEYAWSFNENSMFARKVTGDYANCVSEMENFPHSMYTKSAHYLRYQLLSTAPLGFVGDTFSIFEFNGNGAVNAKRYARVLKEIKPYLSRLSKLDLLPEDMLGVRVLIHEKSSYTLKNAKDFGDLESYDGWLFAYSEQLGIACAYTQDVALRGKIVAVSGEVLRNFSKEEIIALFENNFVILTADNVVALKDLDLLWLIGAKDFEEGPAVFPVCQHIVVADTGPYEDFLHTLDAPGLFQKFQVFTVIHLQFRTWLRKQAVSVPAHPF